MTVSRLKSLGKLALLLGVPVALLLGLFGAGVHCGFEHRAAILGLERDWLGMDVEVPAEPAKTEPISQPVSPPVQPSVQPPVQPSVQPPAPGNGVSQPPQPVVAPGAPSPIPPAQPAALGVVTEPSPVAIAEAAPLPADLQASLGEPVRVRIKVLVDSELVERRPDWIAYAQRHVAWASQVLERQVGVHLELRGVVAWPGPNGRDSATLLADLQNRERDGADLLIGLSSRSFVGTPGLAVPEEQNLGFVVAEANPGSRAPHLRGMLHALGEAFGAAPVIGPGTFMGDVITQDRNPIDLDADSRRRILARKGLQFQTLPDAAPVEEEAAAPEEEAAAAEAAPEHQPHQPLPSVKDKDEEL